MRVVPETRFTHCILYIRFYLSMSIFCPTSLFSFIKDCLFGMLIRHFRPDLAYAISEFQTVRFYISMIYNAKSINLDRLHVLDLK